MTETSQETAVEAHARRRARTRMRRAGWRNADVLRTASLVIAMYVALRVLWVANALVLTAFLGLLIALAVSAGVDRLTRWRVPRGVGAPLIVITFFGLLVAFGAWMAPTLHDQGVELRRRLPDAVDRVESWVNSRRNGFIGLLFSSLASDSRPDSTRLPAATPSPTGTPAAATAPRSGATADSIRVASTLRQRLGGQMSRVGNYLFPFLSSTLEVVSGLFIIIFLSVYIAVDPAMYRRGILHLFPHGRRDRAADVLTAVAGVLRRWLITQLIAMVTIGVVSTVVLAILGVKAAFALGLLSGLMEFIPTVGPIVSSLPAIAMGFLDSPEKALSVAVAYVGIQFLENHLLIPLLMKGGINIPPALTILSQALMAILFGFLGLMCAVPVLAAVITAVKMLYVEDVVGDKQIGPNESPQQSVAS
ncbi:MAG TPA: AI-2E family transporter [Gemmatimonadaceae bacterium]